MSYYRRGYSWENVQYLGAPVGGWDPDGNPWELPESHAPVLDNAIIRPGRVMVRGSLTNWADLSALTTPVPPLNVCGVQPIPGSTKLAIGRKAVSATAFVDPWFAPIVRPPFSNALAQPTTNLCVSQGGTTLTNAVTSIDLIPGPRGITFEGLRYYISYTATAAIPSDPGGTYWAAPTNLCTVNGSGTFTAFTNTPHGFIDIKGYQSRIWGLGGVDTPGSAASFSPTVLFFTNPIASGGGNAASFADWKDPVSGLTNKIQMDGDTLDPGVGLATVRNGLLIFRYQSIWILRGSTTANYALVPVSRDVGCVDPRSIVETDHGVYFLSRQGLMVTDGVTVRNVSGTAMNTLQSAIGLVSGSIKSSFGGYATCAVTSGGQIVVSMGIPSVTSAAPDGHIQPVWCGMYDPASGWTRITSALFAGDGVILTPGNNYPGYVFNTPDRRLMSVGDKYVTLWEAESTATATTTNPVGPNSPTAAANDATVGTIPWTNPANAEVQDGVYATCALTNGALAEYLKVTGFGFAIPANVTISGIIATFLRRSDTHQVQDSNVRLCKAGTITGSNRTVPSTLWSTLSSPPAASFGSGSDLWGTTWTPADINNAGFGVAIAPAGIGTDTAYVDSIRITVYYTLSNTTQQQSFVRESALYDTDAAGNFQPIPFRWRTRLFPVVGTSTLMRKFGQMKRWFCDYVFQGLGLPSANGFTVTPVDASGSLISGSASAQIPPTNNSMTASSISGGQPDASTSIERANADMSSEISDLAFDVTWADAQQSTQPSFVAAELYGVGIEYQPGRDLR